MKGFEKTHAGEIKDAEKYTNEALTTVMERFNALFKDHPEYKKRAGECVL
jgi:hypothetical protein